MPITINEVAKEAGVSITTVSRVLNNNYPVKKETREKIEKAIEKLNYKPNIAARSLITKKTSMIGIVVPSITNLFFSTIVEAIEENIKEKGYNISLCNTSGDKDEEKKIVSQFIARQVDGIIVIDPVSENLKSKFYEEIGATIPLIIVNGSTKGHKCNFISYDQESGTKEAFEYLFSLGHEKILFVRGHKSFSYDLKEELYKNFICSKGLKYEKVLNVGKGNSIETVYKTESKLENILKAQNAPTAIFACNDLMAVGVINICNKLNISVPQEVSVIGFDNTLLSSITRPALTSVDLNMKEIGSRAAVELLDIIENESNIRKKIIFDTKLIIRESCSKVINATVKTML